MGRRVNGNGTWKETSPAAGRADMVAGVSGVGRSLCGQAAEPVPNRIVVLMFDDAAKSHYTFVRPVLTGSPVDCGEGGHSLCSAWNRT